METSNYLIKQTTTGFHCSYCTKKYMRKSDFDRHTLMCKENFNYKMKCDDIDDLELPSQKQMYKIIRELVFKCNHMEEKMNEMQKWVKKNKKKINIVEWLNLNVKPTYGFEDFIKKFDINQKHIEYFIENSFMNTMSFIFQDNFKSNTDIPIYSFVQNINTFYICKHIDEDKYEWVLMSREEFVKFLNNIHYNLTMDIREWKNKNMHNFEKDEKYYDIYNKTLLKLMNVSFKDENTVAKMRTLLYNHLKTDFKNLVEYDFEF